MKNDTPEYVIPHRIDDLEMLHTLSKAIRRIPHRIDDLESSVKTLACVKQIPHRIDDLEIIL